MPALIIALIRPFWQLALGVVAIVAVVLFYEGFLFVDGRIDREIAAARADEKRACDARIQQSIDAARERDAEANRRAVQRAVRDARAAEDRVRQAEEMIDDYESEIAALEPALRACRRASQSDVDRLR